MNKRFKSGFTWFLIIILVISLLLRIFSSFMYPIIWWDEAVYSNLGYELSQGNDYSFRNGWTDFVPYGQGIYDLPRAGFRPPLLPFILSIFYFLKLDFFIKLLMPLIGTLSVFFVYLLGKEMFNKTVGLYSAIIFSLIPVHILYSGRILTDVLSTFLLIVCFYFFWRGFEKNNNRDKILFGLFLGLALLSRYTVLWAFPVFFIYLLIRFKFRFFKDRYFWYSCLIFLLTLSPWLIYGLIEYNNPLGPFIHGVIAKDYWGGTQDWNFFINQGYKLFSILGFVFIFSILFLFFNKRYKEKENYLLLIWVVFFFFMCMNLPHKEDRFIISLLPGISILSGSFMYSFFKNKKLRLALTGLLVVFLISIFMHLFIIYSSNHNINSKCFYQTIDYLNNLDYDYDLISENTLVFHHLTRKQTHYYPGFNISSINSFINSSDNDFLVVFTRAGSTISFEDYELLESELSKNYNLDFNCSLDPRMNFVYSKA
jgi:4-amino-4-deoxy-L-arabinose transferase-like glycosyltransferase